MKRFIKTTLGGVAVACAVLPTAAGAADLGGSLKDAPIVAPETTWSGFYFGGSAGYGHNRSDNIYSDSFGDREKHRESADGGFISSVIGYDRQIRDRFVVGAFADFDWSDFDRGSESNDNGLTITRAWAVGGRLGYLVTPRVMVFGTAGYTQAHFRNDGWWDIDGLEAGRNSQNFSGYFFGGGVEVLLRSNFYLRGELRYSDFGKEITNSGAFGGGTYIDREDPEIFTARLGIVYKMGRDEPVLGMKDGGEVADHTYKVVSINGVDVSDDAWSIYSLSIFALNGDFDRDGFMFRALGVYGDYSIGNNRGVPGTDVDVNDRLGDVMIGYQKVFNRFTATGYVGYEIRDIDASPLRRYDTLHGTKSGFKVAFDVESKDDEKLYFALDGSYSTAFDSVYGQVRVGYNAGSVIIGPEGWVFSDDGDTAWRVGAFAKMPFMIGATRAAEVSIYGGYQFVEDDKNNGGGGFSTHGGEGAYGGAALKIAF